MLSRRGFWGLLLFGMSVASLWFSSYDGGVSALEATGYDVRAFRVGDVIMRRGESLISRGVLAVDRASDFSHVGVVVPSPEGEFSVVHALPRRSGVGGQVIEEDLEAFLSPTRASAAAIYRIDAPDSVLEMAAIKAKALVGTPFDHTFSNPEALYCTELVVEVFAAVGHQLRPRLRRVKLFGVTEGVLFPSDLAAVLSPGPQIFPGAGITR